MEHDDDELSKFDAYGYTLIGAGSDPKNHHIKLMLAGSKEEYSDWIDTSHVTEIPEEIKLTDKEKKGDELVQRLQVVVSQAPRPFQRSKIISLIPFWVAKNSTCVLELGGCTASVSIPTGNILIHQVGLAVGPFLSASVSRSAASRCCTTTKA